MPGDLAKSFGVAALLDKVDLGYKTYSGNYRRAKWRGAHIPKVRSIDVINPIARAACTRAFLQGTSLGRADVIAFAAAAPASTKNAAIVVNARLILLKRFISISSWLVERPEQLQQHS
jgi:hypothetical protein